MVSPEMGKIGGVGTPLMYMTSYAMNRRPSPMATGIDVFVAPAWIVVVNGKRGFSMYVCQRSFMSSVASSSYIRSADGRGIGGARAGAGWCS